MKKKTGTYKDFDVTQVLDDSSYSAYRNILVKLGFFPKENTTGVYTRKYSECNNYVVEVDFKQSKFCFGDLIKVKNSGTLTFDKKENWVVLECIDRLLRKGYKPANIILEHSWSTGHGTSGRLDILVTRDSGMSYMMIECKTWGGEYEKEIKKINESGGQLFTYFQQDKNAEILVLYTSQITPNSSILFANSIIKIEDDYKEAGNVKDLHERWNKLTKNNGVFDDWVTPYDFQSKALTPESLKEITQEDSSFIFNRFLEILRHNVVSDKPNAFNKIFTLFLCKIYDEKSTGKGKELAFQWIDGIDDHISFQKRLTDLYRKGMKEFLEKEVSDLSDQDFEERFGAQIQDAETRRQILNQFTELRLKKNNEFAIKEVFDDASFIDNAKVVKEVVELLQGFQIRYTKRHQYLSDFFELLLTTGLKQESGQFFTPVPIAQFIIKSIPLDKIVLDKLNEGEVNNLLPCIIDYAAGSGHFLTESMHEIQRILDTISPADYIDKTARQIKKWQADHFDWAMEYVYGIEKDYRLVKVGKVGCYLHGDGLARVVHGDGLANFTETHEYQGRLKNRDKYYIQDNKKFDVVLSNPPYSVSAFKGTLKSVEKDFSLFAELTDKSSEIECLFIERTKQLLRDGGIAGIILPSSILVNEGIYTKAREILLQYFDIVAITELGSNTFMATGTNTVVLFLRRRKNEVSQNIRILSDAFPTNQDVTINHIETPVKKYIQYVWKTISYEDYLTLIDKNPNKRIKSHELYREYQNKIKAKTAEEFWSILLQREQEKRFYFILAYPQRTVCVKTGEKNEEKRFLGYEFSNRRGSEGIHPVVVGNSIEECTRLFDAEHFDNPIKASTYIYKAFEGDSNSSIDPSMQNNVSRHNLLDMMTFDRSSFEKSISLSFKKKVDYNEVWKSKQLIPLVEIAQIEKGTSITKDKVIEGKIPVIAGGQGPAYYHNKSNRVGNIITVSASGAYSGFVSYFKDPIFASDCNTIQSLVEKDYPTKLIYEFLKAIQEHIYELQRGQAQPHVYGEDLAAIKLPALTGTDARKMLSKLQMLDEQEEVVLKSISTLTQKILDTVLSSADDELVKLSQMTTKIGSGATPKGGEASYHTTGVTLIRSQNVYDGYFLEKGLVYINDTQADKLKNVAVQRGDVLFNITGASVCRCCMVDERHLPARVNQHVAIIRANDRALPEYIQLALVSSEYKRQLLAIADNSSTREAITKAQLEDFAIPLPALPKQKHLVNSIKAIQKQIQLCELELQKLKQERLSLVQKRM